MYHKSVSLPKVTAEDIRNLHRDYPFTKNYSINVVDTLADAEKVIVERFNSSSDKYEYVSEVLEIVEDFENKTYCAVLKICGD